MINFVFIRPLTLVCLENKEPQNLLRVNVPRFAFTAKPVRMNLEFSQYGNHFLLVNFGESTELASVSSLSQSRPNRLETGSALFIN